MILRLSSIQATVCKSGFLSTIDSARLANSLISTSLFETSLAKRMTCSCLSRSLKRNLCWLYSTSRLTASSSLSFSSTLRYQNDKTIALKNKTTAAMGAKLANRSCLNGLCFFHQRSHKVTGFLANWGMVLFVIFMV